MTNVEKFKQFVANSLEEARVTSTSIRTSFKVADVQARLTHLTVQSMTDEELSLFLTEYGYISDNNKSLMAAISDAQTAFGHAKFRFMFELAGGDWGEWERNDNKDYAATWEKITESGITRDMSVEAGDQFYHALIEGMEPLINFVNSAHKEVTLREQRVKDSSVTVSGAVYQVAATAEVLWSGWEMDNKAWAVQSSEGVKLVASSHGSTYFAEASFLEDKIAHYEQVIAQSKALLALLAK